MVTTIVSALRNRRATLGSLLTLSIKGGGTVLMALIFLLVARASSPADFGELAVSFNALSFLAVFAIFGQDTLIVRCWSEYAGRDNGLARGAYWFGWRIVGLCAVVSCAAALLFGLFGPFKFTLLEIVAGCAFLAMQICLAYSSNTCRHILTFVISEPHRELTWRLILLAIVLAMLNRGLTPAIFFGAAAFGMAVAIAFESLAMARGFPAAVAKAPMEIRARDWMKRARSMWMSASVEAAAQYAEVMLLGFLVSPAVAGGYFVAARVANIFAMLATGLHTYTVSHAANLFFSAETPRLQAMLRSVMTVALCMTAPILLVILFFGTRILGLFGPHYAAHFSTLIVLAAASFTAALAGPSPAILLTTGHERLYSRVISCALVVRIGLLLWLAPRYGALGAAVGWAMVNAPVAVGLALACRSFCGVDPSILSVFWTKTDHSRAAMARSA